MGGSKLFQSAIRLLPSKGDFTHLSQLTTGNIIVLLITIVGYPILSRLYTDEQFGELAIFQSSIVILTQLSTLNYEEALVLIKKRTTFRTVFTTAFSLNLCLSLILSVLISVGWILELVPRQYIIYLWLLPFVMIFRANMQIGRYSFISHKLFKKVSALKVLDRSSFQILSTGFGLLKLPFNFLVIGYSMANLLSGLYSFFNSKGYLTLFESWKVKRKVMFDYRDFPKYALPAIFLDQLSRQLPVYFITYIISTEITGQFSMAYRVLSIPEMIIGASVGQLFYKRLSELKQDNQPVEGKLIKAWALLLIIGIIPFGIIMLFGETLFSFIFGIDWLMAGKIAACMAPMLLAMFISTPTSSVFTVFRSQRKSLIINIGVLIARTLVLYLGLSHLPILEAIWLFTCVEILLIVIYNIAAWQLLKAVRE